MSGRVEAIPVVAAVILRGDRFLVCQRPATKRHGGLWEFPGGKQEPGEGRLEAARRELLEELGIAVTSVGEPLLALNDPGSQFVIEFVPTVVEGEPICLEHAALRWADLGELEETDLAPSDRRFVEFLRNS